MVVSRQIRKQFASNGYTLPKKGSSLNHHVFKFVDHIKEKYRILISEAKKKGSRFNITLDEWSSRQKRRFVNLNLHFIDDQNELCYLNLGMIYVKKAKCSAEYLHELIVERLGEFGLTENDIMASQSDGASVMLKFGRISAFESITCYSHAIHLAICDILYDKLLYIDPEEEYASSDSDATDELDESDKSDDDFEILEEIDVDANEKHLKLKNIFADSISHVRGICQYFTKSIPRHIILQQQIKKQFNHEISLKTDMRIRWNSIFTMLSTFLKVKDCVKETLNIIGNEDKYDEELIMKATEIRDVLSPIYDINKKLGLRNSDLLKADVMFDVLFKKLDTLATSSFFAKNLLVCLKGRIHSRRSQIIVSSLKFLNSPSDYVTKTDHFEYSSKKEVKKYLIDVYSRLYQQGAPVSASSSSSSVEANKEDDFETSLNMALDNLSKKKAKPTSGSINQQLIAFDKSGVLTADLKSLNNTLKSIPPTSVEAERNFSLSGHVVSKTRTRLANKMIDSIMIVKAYFINLYKK